MKKVGIGILLVGVLFIAALVISKHYNNHAPVSSVVYKSAYVALGDSVAAGIGLQGYSDSSACDRTNQSYPNIVASSLKLKLTSLACSGATLAAGILGKQDVNQLMVKPQLTALFSLPKPKLITITIGANDINWTSLITKCYQTECGSPSDTTAVNQALTTVTTNLQSMLTQIQQQYGSAPPTVIVTGYHEVFPSGSIDCSDLTGIDAAERVWGRAQQANLSATIQTTVNSFSFAKFTAIDFTGHELCTQTSWVQGLNGSDPYHPTAAGQAAYAKQVVSTYRQLPKGRTQ